MGTSAQNSWRTISTNLKSRVLKEFWTYKWTSFDQVVNVNNVNKWGKARGSHRSHLLIQCENLWNLCFEQVLFFYIWYFLWFSDLSDLSSDKLFSFLSFLEILLSHALSFLKILCFLCFFVTLHNLCSFMSTEAFLCYRAIRDF